MRRIEALALCRQSLAAITDAEAELQQLQRIRPSGDEREAVAQQIEHAQDKLQLCRKAYPWRMDAAQKALTMVTGPERTVLWRYYVLGETLRQISDEIGLNYRDVQKRKADGLARLDRADQHGEMEA